MVFNISNESPCSNQFDQTEPVNLIISPITAVALSVFSLLGSYCLVKYRAKQARKAEIEGILKSLGSDNRRHSLLVGPTGIGKTEIIQRFVQNSPWAQHISRNFRLWGN